MKKSPPSFEAIGGYGDYYAVGEERKVLRVNFQSAEETLCDKYETSSVRMAIRQYERAAYEFIRHFRRFLTMDPVEKQFAAMEAVRTSTQAADYFLKNQIKFKWNLFAFEMVSKAAREGNIAKFFKIK